MSFELAEAIKTANQLVVQKAGRHLTDVEILVLRGSWEKLEYEEIAVQSKYATSYISQDAAPKLWKLLSSALGEKIRKSNFKEALRRSWETPNEIAQTEAIAPTATPQTPADIYILRPPAEQMCCEALMQPGALVRIKAPRFMGKTALANFLMGYLWEANYRTVKIGIELADSNTHLTNLNKFLRWLCLNISRELAQPHQLDALWDEEGIGAKVSCTAYFEEYLLASDQPLILCLDNVDILFGHPEVYEDFFGLLRSWHEKAKRRPLWQQLRLIIVHATDVYIRLNINQSPFNVGVAVALPDFSVEQVQALTQQSGLNATQRQVKALLSWVGGHPHLLRQIIAYQHNHPNANLTDILASVPTILDVYRDHLREQWVLLQENPQLVSAFTKVLYSPTPIQLDPVLTYQLQSLGLAKTENPGVAIRCRLYEVYFKQHLEPSR